MKKFTKITLIVACVFLALGIITFTTGYVLGGSSATQEVKDAYRNSFLGNFITEHHGISFKIDDVTDFVTDFSDALDDHHDTDSHHVRNKSFSASEIRIIQIDCAVNDIRIQTVPSLTDTFTVDATYNSKREDITVSDLTNGILTIRSHKRYSFFKFHEQSSSVITINVPEHFTLDRLDINLDVGNLYINGPIEINECELDLDVVNATLSKLHATDLSASINIGDFNAADLDIGHSVDMDADLASISLTICGRSSDFDYELESDLGSVTVDGQKFTRELGGYYNATGTTGKEISIESDAGNVTIEFTDHAIN